MKLGTLEDAKNICAEIYTPKICHNETEASMLEELIIRAEVLNPEKCLILLFHSDIGQSQPKNQPNL